jgi:predicted enzyme related to lactoylglutathione lyase
MAKLKKINVVFLYVTDMAREREFYEGVLEMGPPLFKTPSWVEYKLEEGAHFALHHSPAECLDGVDRSRNTIKFSIVVDDLAATHAELCGKGVTFTRTPEKGYGFDIAEFQDPEGNEIRLLQYTTMKVRD